MLTAQRFCALVYTGTSNGLFLCAAGITILVFHFVPFLDVQRLRLVFFFF